jgi:hypothetical protein
VQRRDACIFILQKKETFEILTTLEKKNHRGDESWGQVIGIIILFHKDIVIYFLLKCYEYYKIDPSIFFVKISILKKK